MNCKIHPVLYHWYLILREQLGASIVHRRQRRSQTCIEVIFLNGLAVITGSVNSLPEAEKCGYWVICRPQTKPGHTTYKDHPVFQLYLSPVHPKKHHGIQPIFLPDFVKQSATSASAVG